ncbi:MAG: enoyl-CoA hydratase/isomerase family protein [Pseudorhodobacter sp.]|nr:enoyl-CoA hydratase/isomerase family protein [Rhizobacter sp.]
MMDPLLRERTGHTERWVLNSPATRNSLTDTTVEALVDACGTASIDSNLRFIVLTGSGGSFCAGGSLGGFSKLIGQPLAQSEIDPLLAMNQRFGDLLQALTALPQILIAAVDGPAMGGGLGLVCCADFCVATQRASFAAPEVTLGLVPAQIAPFVWRRLGDRLARQFMLQGRKLTAAQAHDLGLVDQCVDGGEADLFKATEALIRSLQASAPQAVADTKKLMSAFTAAPDIRAEAALAFATSLRGAEAPEGINAFAQKRAPAWAT